MESFIASATGVCIVHIIGQFQFYPDIFPIPHQYQFSFILDEATTKYDPRLSRKLQLLQQSSTAKINSLFNNYNRLCKNVGTTLIIKVPYSGVKHFQNYIDCVMSWQDQLKEVPLHMFIELYPNHFSEGETFLEEAVTIYWFKYSTKAEIFVYNEQASTFKINFGCVHIPTSCPILVKCSLNFAPVAFIECPTTVNFHLRLVNLHELIGMITYKPAENDCSLVSRSLNNSPQECILSVFHNLMNLTSNFNHDGSVITYNKISFYYNALNKVTVDILKLFPQRMDFIVHGFSIEPFEFVILTSLNSASAEAFLIPFTFTLWICVLLSDVLFFWFLLTLKQFNDVSNTIFWIVSTIVLQINSTFARNVLKNYGLLHGCVLVLWMLFVFILVFFYQGNLLSSLIMKSIPDVPKTLKSAMELEIPFYTTDKMTIYAFHTLSTLKSLIIPDLILQFKNDDNFLAFIKNLTNVTSFLEDETTILSNTSLNLFGLIDSPQSLARMIQIVLLANRNGLAVVRNFDINPLTTSSAWVLQQNILYKTFSLIFGRLVSNGFADLWTKYFNIFNQFFTLANVLKVKLSPSFADAAVISEGRVFNWINNGKFISISGHGNEMRVEADSITIQVFFYPLVLFTVFNLVSVFLFLGEYCISVCLIMRRQR